MTTYNIVSFADGYFFGQKLMTVDRKLDIISDMLKVYPCPCLLVEFFLRVFSHVLKGLVFPTSNFTLN